ncbi:MAG: hypothetical protein DRO11_07840 [Methanobacteriota archaeon]|nr:MAG: hypothetical protein DRO11_07840 [Euryarchaeota archaeon]HDN78901.1 hypothetical protein [Chloroflexota bacterium]
MAGVKTVLDTISIRLLEEAKAGNSKVLVELLKRGFEQRLLELYEEYKRGECSLGYMAEQLGVTTWELTHLLEERGLQTT